MYATTISLGQDNTHPDTFDVVFKDAQSFQRFEELINSGDDLPWNELI